MYIAGKQGTLFNATQQNVMQQSESENVVTPPNNEPYVGNVSVSVTMSRQESVDCTYNFFKINENMNRYGSCR